MKPTDDGYWCVGGISLLVQHPQNLKSRLYTQDTIISSSSRLRIEVGPDTDRWQVIVPSSSDRKLVSYLIRLDRRSVLMRLLDEPRPYRLVFVGQCESSDATIL